MIRPHLRMAGWELGITGSVLFEGSSTKDGDIIVYPTDESSFDLGLLYAALETLGLNQEFSYPELIKVWRVSKSNDIKHVEVWSYKGKRLDLFILW